ncbi:endonuclease/exonuclease/phosphatase family protein [Pseudoduganella sp.]|uniref:endonuclease/exonuclease/phosphatase family protein n=1 Tax=Pseudoduganella sp. TaxID=1880898 RepID=UPI0035B0689B
MEIKCAWWNTSLAPTKDDKRASVADQKVARDLIEELLQARNVDLLGMCEVSLAQIELLAEVFEPLGFGVANGVEQINQSKTDTCLLFNKSKFELGKSVNIRVTFRDSIHKIAQRVELKNLLDNSIVTVFLSHWAGVRMKGKGTPERATLGNHLRAQVDSIFEVDSKAKIILMGDYNDEPFDTPLAYELSATRDRLHAASKTKRIYNPFWHRIGSDRIDNGTSLPNLYGTYFYHRDKIDRWRTFDQIMVSTSLLDSKGWALDEASVEILNIPSFTPHVLDKKRHFDHFPVEITIKRAVR